MDIGFKRVFCADRLRTREEDKGRKQTPRRECRYALTLLLFHQSSLELPPLRCSEREPLALEPKLDVVVLRRKQVINLVKNRSFVLSAICLGGSTNCKIKQVIVDLGIAAYKIAVFQNFSYTEDLSDVLTFHLPNWAEALNCIRIRSPPGQRLRAEPLVKRSVAVPCVPCPTLSRLAVLDLIPMLFQDDTHQLTARPRTGRMT